MGLLLPDLGELDETVASTITSYENNVFNSPEELQVAQVLLSLFMESSSTDYWSRLQPLGQFFISGGLTRTASVLRLAY